MHLFNGIDIRIHDKNQVVVKITTGIKNTKYKITRGRLFYQFKKNNNNTQFILFDSRTRAERLNKVLLGFKNETNFRHYLIIRTLSLVIEFFIISNGGYRLVRLTSTTSTFK